MFYLSRKRIRFPILFFCITCGLLTSCLEDINLDTGERILNVYCVLKQGSEQVLELSYIAPTGGTSLPVGEGVSITLYNEGTPTGQFTRVSETKWNLHYTPQGGHTYRLEIKVSDEETLTAETRYPPISTLQEVYLPKDVMLPDGSSWTSSFRAFELNADEDQILWCSFECRKDGHAFVDYVATDHPGADQRGESIYVYDSKSSVWDHSFYTSNTTFYEDATPYLHETIVRIVHPAGFKRSEGKVMLALLNEYSQVISLEEGDASMFCLAGVNRSRVGSDLVIYSVSEEYDAYLADYYYGRYSSDDFASSVYKRNHYSNIQNGTGVFGACHEYRKEGLSLYWNPYEPMLY